MSKALVKCFQLKILSRVDFTDSRLLVLMKKRPTAKEYSSIIQQMEISNENSKMIFEFIANFDNGFFLPEKCDAYEPEREKFDINNLSLPISWLSQPGGAVYLKKMKPFKYEGVIENNRIAPIWEDRNSPLLLNENDPSYLVHVWLHIDEKILKLKSKDYFLEFFNSLFEIIKGEYGYIKSPEGEVIIEVGKLE